MLNPQTIALNHRFTMMIRSPDSVSPWLSMGDSFLAPCSYKMKPCRKTPPLQNGIMSCRAMASYSTDLQETSRRSANYHPTIWDHHFIESTLSSYSDKQFRIRLKELKLEVKLSLEALIEPLAKLEFIDSMQRLGVAYHFEKEIKDVLDRIHSNGFENVNETALCFRLLRQHGYNVSSDLLRRFDDNIDKKGFKNRLAHDAKGLQSLYEASHLAIPGEEVLAEAKEFSARHLKSLIGKVEVNIVEEVTHSLEIPLHWRMPRLEARHYIDVYEGIEGKSSVLLELAKLDYNVVQSVHLMELKELSRWWKDLQLAEKLKFSRDRLVENYLWAMGIAFEPQFSKCRKGLTKEICILTVIDDIYDVYGSLEELKLFTKAIERWDLKSAESLPGYMRFCYLALHDIVNEMASDILEDHGFDVKPLIKREWERLCKAYLVEAEWFTRGYTPTLEEYLENAWISVGGPIAMTHAYFLLGHTLTKDSINCLEQGSRLIYLSSLITRLSDDLGTSKAEMERGDTPKSLQCHMNQTDESEESSREHMKGLVSNLWMELNKECLEIALPRSFVNMVLNMARTSQCIFEHGDGIGSSTGEMKDRITALFFEHVPFE